ncbi:MAG: S8 family serine peptidase [Firmicutes bacterium]|nr:S8 family serine peptidase [Bacillota bacterium]
MKCFRKIMSLLMIFAMVLTFSPIRAFVFAESGGSSPGVTWEVVETDREKAASLIKRAEDPEIQDTMATFKESVRVSIVLEKASTLERGYKAKDIAKNRQAVAYRQSLKAEQEDMAALISRTVLGGKQLDVVWNLTLAANIISANVPEAKIPAIKALDGVKDVIIEKEYEHCAGEETGAQPNMSVASQMTGEQGVWAAGYTGAGSLVAIVDTGLDYKHQSFSADAFDYAISKVEEATEKPVDILTLDDVSSVWTSLHAYERSGGTADQAYFNSKVPFGFNYKDRDFNIEHLSDLQGEHGSHVAGITAANRYIPDGEGGFANALTEVRTQGNAPDAQILVMKVFGSDNRGASDGDYFAAIEDAIVLGADAVNLSLGSSSKGFSFSTGYQDVVDSLAGYGINIIWSNSAGNSGTWADSTLSGYLYSDYANIGTTGSPATFATTLSVASVDNDGLTAGYFLLNGEMLYYIESQGYGNTAMGKLTGDLGYVYLDSIGSEAEFAAIGEDALRGKVVICNRGSLNFVVKANNAVKYGAAAVIIANNVAGTMGLNLTGYLYSAPVVSITQSDGARLRAAAASTGTIEVDGATKTYYVGTFRNEGLTETTEYDSDYYTMSSFSSWGVPEDLSMKPEITAPGGNIYSINGLAQIKTSTGLSTSGGHDEYENMSGTSMAAPQITGIVAALAQYFRESDGLGTKVEALGLSQRQALQSLLMSTAVPLMQEGDANVDDSYYSVMQQGAGLADANAVVNAKSIVLMEGTAVNGEVRKDISAYAADGKVKAELGDDPDKTGKYSVEFTLNNITDEDLYFELDGDMFTQDIFQDYTYYTDGEGLYGVTDEEGNYLPSVYLDTRTYGLMANLTWTVDGKEYHPGVDIDINGDGTFNDKDAQAILNNIVGDTESGNTVVDAKAADFDDDKKITSYDAYLALDLANVGSAFVPANSSVSVKVDIALAQDDIGAYDYWSNGKGAYVEGYIFAREIDSEDGAKGVQHSVPVLGYYGSWDEPPMKDMGSAVEYEYGLEYRTPYMPNDIEEQVGVQGIRVYNSALDVTYIAGGNPVITDDTYKPERTAISSSASIAGARYTLVRNSAGYRFVLYDEDGAVINEKAVTTLEEAAFVYNGEWENSVTSSSYGYRPTELAEGDRVFLEFYLAPEYYLDTDTAEIAWDEIHSTTFEMPFVIDNTAPEVSSITAERVSGEEGTSTIKLDVSASDNEYIAAFVVYDENGNAPFHEEGAVQEDKEAGTRDERSFELTFDGTVASDHLLIQVWDYAANLTSVKVNLNKEELQGDISVSVDPTAATVIAGSSTTLTAAVNPWGFEDQRVTWSSSDEEVATVEDGVVYGVKVGQAVITATSVADPTKSASCAVEVIAIENDLNAVIWDEEADIWFSQFNTRDLSTFTKLHVDPQEAALATTTYGKDGVLYAASLDTQNYVSTLYRVDEETYEATAIGDSEIAYMDLAPTKNLGDNILLGTYGTYVVIIDTTTGGDLGGFQFSGATSNVNLVGITYVGSIDAGSYGMADEYILLDQSGTIYLVMFVAVDGSYMNTTPQAMGLIGDAVDRSYFQSLYFDGTDLYWSRFNYSDNEVELIMLYDLFENGEIFSLGTFNKEVWPVGGLFNAAGKTFITTNSMGEATLDGAEFITDSFVTDIEPVTFMAESSAKGSLNAAAPAAVRSRDDIQGVTVETGDEDVTSTVTVEAAGNVEDGEGGFVTHNGLYEVSYDPAKATLVSVSSNLKYFAYKESTGKVTLAFADLNGVAKGATVATLVFSTEDGVSSEVKVGTKESEEDFTGSEETYTIGNGLTVVVCDSDTDDGLREAYTIDGRVVTVDFDKPCKVGVLQADGTYAALDAVANGDGTYKFTAPVGTTSVVLVVKGDADLDGEVGPGDANVAKAVVLKKENITVDAIMTFAADTDGDGEIGPGDANVLRAVVLKKATINW